MRIFITGASGYAGYYAALHLAGAGHQVTGVVRHPEQPRLNTLRIQEVNLVHGDVADPETYKRELERSDVVIHTMLDKKRPLDTDRAMFAALRALPPRSARLRFIYTTGCSIFGKLPILVMDETVEPNPTHALAFRRTLEKEALALDGIDTVVLRPGFMFGNDGYNCASGEWFAMTERGEVAFRGDRERGWSWIHIGDLSEAYRLVAEVDSRAVAHEVFHLADDLRPKSLDVMRACVAAAGFRGEVPFIEQPREGENLSSWFNQNEFITSQKARDRLGWRPRHPGVMDCIEQIYASWKAARSAK